MKREATIEYDRQTSAVATGVQAALNKQAARRLQRRIAANEAEAKRQTHRRRVANLTPEERAAAMRRSMRMARQIGIPIIDMSGGREQ